MFFPGKNRMELWQSIHKKGDWRRYHMVVHGFRVENTGSAFIPVPFLAEIKKAKELFVKIRTIAMSF